MDHFEQDPFVARQPLAEDAITFAVVHGFTFPGARPVATDGRLGASARGSSWDFAGISGAGQVFSYTQC
ncbi:hypothetical protein D3C83_123090 [compost metagenome]